MTNKPDTNSKSVIIINVVLLNYSILSEIEKESSISWQDAFTTQTSLHTS